MLLNSIVLNSLLMVILTFVVHQTKGQECICNAKYVGEYCGSELNLPGSAGNCSNELIYFCGKSNMHKEAAPVRACSEKGYQCLTKENKDNPCYQNLYCNCGETHTRKKKYCGAELVGAGCKHNIVYKCPMFRGNKINVEDACTNGCANGKCL